MVLEVLHLCYLAIVLEGLDQLSNICVVHCAFDRPSDAMRCTFNLQALQCSTSSHDAFEVASKFTFLCSNLKVAVDDSHSQQNTCAAS